MANNVIDDLLGTLLEGTVDRVLIGAHWTAVVTRAEGQLCCGLASSLEPREDHHHGGGPAIREAGQLHHKNARELAELVHSASPPEVSVGMAAINALLPLDPDAWFERNAVEIIAERGADKHVALVGHFPFVPRLRERVGRLSVLELEPQGKDLPAEAADEIIPQADVVALTSMTLLNRTFEGLARLCRPESLVLMLGPTTPLSPLLFDYGVDLLSGSVVTKLNAVLQTVGQGGNFRQVHRAGVRLVTMGRE